MRLAAANVRQQANIDRARLDLLGWVQSTHKRYKAGWVHHRTCAKLEEFSAAVARGESPRLIVVMPPRTGKTAIVGVRWLVWHMVKHADHECVYATYNQKRANKISRKARGVARSKAAGRIFGELGSAKRESKHTPPDKSWLDEEEEHEIVDAVEEWTISNGSSYAAVGIGAGLTGNGAHIALIDDYCKDRAWAQSEVRRDATWDWYTSTVYTRLAPGGGILVMATRWHSDDLIGRLLKAQETGGDQWEVLHFEAISTEDEPVLPGSEELAGVYQRQVETQASKLEKKAAQLAGAAAYFENKWETEKATQCREAQERCEAAALAKRCEGLKEDEAGLPLWRRADEALHPARYNKALLLKTKGAITQRVGLRDWEALYQGNPIARTGNRIQRAWFRERYNCTPEEIADQADEVWGTSDPAKKAGAKNDYHSLQIWSRRGKKRHLLARVCGRMEYPEYRRRMDGMIGTWQRWLILGGNGFLVEDTANGTNYLQEREGSHLGVDLIAFLPTRDTPGTDKSKGARFTYLEGPAEAGGIVLPDSSNEPWAEEWLDCVCAYPDGVHDDEGDAASQLHMRWTLQEHEGGGGHWDMW